MSNNNLDVLYMKERVGSESVKPSSTILSQHLQIPDSIIGVLINCKGFKEFFIDSKLATDELKKLVENTKEPLSLLPVHLNNSTQKAQISSEEERIYLKDLTSKIERMSSVPEFKNEFGHLKLVLKFLAHSMHHFRSSNGLEETDEENDEKHSLVIAEKDEEKFKTYDKVIEDYNDAQELIQEIDPKNIKDFMSSSINRYDSLYTVQECIRFFLRSLYGLNHDFEVNFNMTLNLYFGIPIYNLKGAQRANLLEWSNNRNWPDEEDVEGEDRLKKTGFELGKWAQRLIDIIRHLEEEKFDAHDTEEKINFYPKITECETSEIKWLHAPLLKPVKDEIKEFNCSAIDLPINIYLNMQLISCSLIDNKNLHLFEEVQISSMNLQQGTGDYSDIRKELCKKAGINCTNTTNFVIAANRNKKMASFNFDDKIKDVQFIGDTLFFYKVENARNLISEGTHNLLFIRLTRNFLLPILLKTDSPLKDQFDEIFKKLNEHRMDFTHKTLKEGLMFGNEVVDLDKSLQDYYKRIETDIGTVNENQMQENEMQENDEESDPNLLKDKNSLIGVMFSFSDSSKVPSYSKKQYQDKINFKVSLGVVITKYYESLKKEDVENSNLEMKYLESDILAVEVSRCSKKVDLVSDFELDFEKLKLGVEGKSKFRNIAILSKLYNAYDLLLRKDDQYYSSNNPLNLIDKKTVLDEKLAAVAFYQKIE